VCEGNIVTRHSQDESICTLDIISHGTAQTQRLAMRLGELLLGGELILLDGQLGTGKTTFAQGLAKGLHIDEVISSPTFTLLKEYPGQPLPPSEVQSDQPRHGMSIGPALYHFDLYRIDDPEEILDLGFEEYFYDSGVCVVEWAGKANMLWSAEKLHIRMKVLSETKRSLLFTATGSRYCELLRQFQKNTYASASS
jgi:tRNA threonylcarbamoyladenosine biosynthesis protein TsaE